MIDNEMKRNTHPNIYQNYKQQKWIRILNNITSNHDEFIIIIIIIIITAAATTTTTTTSSISSGASMVQP